MKKKIATEKEIISKKPIVIALNPAGYWSFGSYSSYKPYYSRRNYEHPGSRHCRCRPCNFKMQLIIKCLLK